MAALLQRFGRTVLDLVYPPRCALCGRSGPFLCDGCTAGLPVAGPPRCPRCWRLDHPRRHRCPLAGDEFLIIRAPYIYEGGVRELVHRLKYDGMSALAEPMGALLLQSVREHGLTADTLAPVPLHPRRQRSRGYNQAEALARVVARGLDLPIRTTLQRTRPTVPQVQQRSAEERARNVAGAFVAREPVHGLTLMLVDDVTTTGSTLLACARALQEAGAARVIGFTFALED